MKPLLLFRQVAAPIDLQNDLQKRTAHDSVNQAPGPFGLICQRHDVEASPPAGPPGGARPVPGTLSDPHRGGRLHAGPALRPV